MAAARNDFLDCFARDKFMVRRINPSIAGVQPQLRERNNRAISESEGPIVVPAKQRQFDS